MNILFLIYIGSLTVIFGSVTSPVSSLNTGNPLTNQTIFLTVNRFERILHFIGNRYA